MNHQAIYNTHPNVVSIDDSKGAMDANGNLVTIDQAAYEAEVARLQAEYAATQYQRDRKQAYASIEEQLDMQYWDSVNGTTTWADHIAAVKGTHPKP
jgi:multidrug resistance efflux pump